MSSGTVRVALREVVETSFRALRVVGASHGEAQVLAEDVLCAQLRDGAGIDLLSRDLDVIAGNAAANDSTAAGDSAASGFTELSCSRGTVHGRAVLEVAAGARSGPLRLGRMLIELAAGDRVTVISRGVCELTSLVDRPLFDAARSLGSAVAIVETTADGHRVRAADPSGRLGVGMLTDAEVTAAGVPSFGPDTPTAVVPDLSETGAAALVWSEYEDLPDASGRAAAGGLDVPGPAWASVYRRSREYLQPETGDARGAA